MALSSTLLLLQAIDYMEILMTGCFVNNQGDRRTH